MRRLSHRPPRPPRGARLGFTLTEVMMAITMLLLVFAIAIPFFRSQVKAMTKSAGRDDAQQNARFAMSTIDRELRVAGSGIVNTQPLVVQADPYAVTFNADLVTTDPTDPASLYHDPSANPAAVDVLPNTRRITLPRSTFVYPDSTYMQAKGSQNGTPLSSRAETISYWFSLDSSTARTDDYVLFRRANDMPAEIIGKGFILPAGQPAFRYFKLDSLGNSVEIAQTKLPIFHKSAIHGANADTGTSALTDSIRAVRVRFTAMYKSPTGDTARRSVEQYVRLLNAGLVHFSSCGDVPLSAPLTASLVKNNGIWQVSLTWPPSTDENAGEKDVDRYALYRRAAGAPDWGEPIASVPSGLATYQFTDASVKSGESWQYALVAQDCTPSTSVESISAVVVVP